jgi:hypothetical protein
MEDKICRPEGRRYISHVAAMAFVAAAFRRAALRLVLQSVPALRGGPSPSLDVPGSASHNRSFEVLACPAQILSNEQSKLEKSF